jgi:hypothetical protein
MSNLIMGIDPTKVRTSTEGPEFRVGTRGMVTNVTGGPKEYIYVSSAAGITGAGYIVAIDPVTFGSVMTVAATGDAGTGMFKPVGVGQAAVAAGGYGWVQVRGACTVRAAAAAAIYTRLAVTATAGAVDDATGATLNWVEGLVLTTAAIGAETVAGFANYPYLGIKSA